MDAGNIAAIFIATIGALVSWLTHRSATKASLRNVEGTNRVEMEKEAYERARKLDTETIVRQDNEIVELMAKNKALITRNEELDRQVRNLLERVSSLESHVQTLEREKNEH